MKLHISLSAIANLRPEEVLRRIAHTISPKHAIHKVLNDYTHTGKLSCYGSVAAHIRDNLETISPNLIIYLYNSIGSQESNEVAHVCLYDKHGNEIMDTFSPGHPARTKEGLEYYHVPAGKERFADQDETDLRLIYKMTLGEFFHHYFRDSAESSSRFTSESAGDHGHKKGDRVITRVKKNEWYTGTVKRAGAKVIKVDFDDGYDADIEPEDFKHVKPMLKDKKSKKPLTLAEAKLLYKAPKAEKIKVEKKTPKVKTKVKIDLEPVKKPKLKKVKTKPVAPPIKLKPVAPLAPNIGIDPNRKGKQIPEDLYLKCGDAVAFERAVKGGKTGLMQYLYKAFERANHAIFGGQLRRPEIYLMKLQKTSSFRGRGIWKPSRRMLGISPRLFIAGEAHVLNTFIHEMCHQAVTEIDRVNDRTEGGHGPNWVAWMRKAGIPASRYDMTDATEYMTDHEKALKEKRDNAKATAYKGKTQKHYARTGDVAQFFDTRALKWVTGVVAGVYGSKMHFLDSPYMQTWVTLPNKGVGWLYELDDPSSASQYKTPQWQAAIERVHNANMRLKERRAIRKGVRSGTLVGWNGLL